MTLTPHFQSGNYTVYHGDCIDVMRQLPESSVDSIVTDPPYGLGFMGKDWDDLPPGLDFAVEAFRVLKPGGHILAFGGTRTWHRLAVAVEDAGFEIRDSIAWLYGSGFPKSLDVSKAIDKAAGATREPSGATTSLACEFVRAGVPCEGHAGESATSQSGLTVHALPTSPATDAARQWQGWGTALKPAFEPIVVGRKPLIGTVAANVLAHGTGALNIDGTRTVTTDDLSGGAYAAVGGRTESASLRAGGGMNVPGATVGKEYVAPVGRFPANVVLDESQAAALDAASGYQRDGTTVNRNRPEDGSTYDASSYMLPKGPGPDVTYGGGGGASRFFPTFRYEAKAPGHERPVVGGVAHPTVKPLALMQWLARLVTPPAGIVLEPFAGSGTTLEACIREGFGCIAIERDASSLPLIESRIGRDHQQSLFDDGA